MGKVKLLLDVIEDIRSLADSLEAVADAMTHSDPPAAEPEAPKAAPTPVNEDPAPATKAPLQCFCLENPRDGRAWWAAFYGVAQSRTRLKQLSA